MTDKAAGSAQSNALANVHDYFPTLSEKQRSALAKWAAFEAIVNAPFIPNQSAARAGIFFTVLRLGEGRFPDIDDPSERVDKWLVFVRMAHNAQLALKDGTLVEFRKDQLAKIAFRKDDAGLRDQTAQSIAQILADDGEIPAMQLRELPAKTKGQDGAVVLHTPFEAVL